MTIVTGTRGVSLWAGKPVTVLDNLDVTAPAKKVVLETRLLVNLKQQGKVTSWATSFS